MKDLAGTSVAADIKTKGSSRSDAKSLAAVDGASGQARAADDPEERRNAAHRSLSAETQSDAYESQNDTKQRLERQEGDIIVILQNLQALQKEMKGFQKDIILLKTSADDMRVRQDEQQNDGLIEDLEMLAEGVSNVSGRLGEVDSLKLEIKMMQSRVKRLEDEKRVPQTSMGPPPTPRSVTNGGRPIKSYNKAQEKPLGSNISSPHPSGYKSAVDSALHRARAASVHRDYTHTAALDPALNRSRGASVQHDHVHRSHSRSDMPPPEVPNRAASRNAPELRSSSDSTRTHRSQNNLHNAISALNESASEFPEVVEDSDEEYDNHEPSPDPEDESYRPRRSRQSLPTRLNSGGIDGEYKANPQKRRRTTSHALNRDPSPHPNDPAYQSIWAAATESEIGAPAPAQRNAHGFLIKPNGQIDKRSLRFLGKAKNKRRSVPKHAMRDVEGYLLNSDGTRNERSVSIIDGMRKREQEESEAPGRSREASE